MGQTPQRPPESTLKLHAVQALPMHEERNGIAHLFHLLTVGGCLAHAILLGLQPARQQMDTICRFKGFWILDSAIADAHKPH